MKFLSKIFSFLFIFLFMGNYSHADEILDLYKHLHANPELSWQEYMLHRGVQ